jgi:predicted NAD/FAD-binding protein
LPRRIGIIGAGVAGLGAAWALHKHPERFDITVFEAAPTIGGNAITVDMPQSDGRSIPFDISVTACIPTVYHNYLQFLRRHNIDLVDTQFNYSVRCRDDIYAHNFNSALRKQLQPEIDRFQKLLAFLSVFNRLSKSRSKALAMLNPFNYVSMGALLNLGRFSGDFRYKLLKPMFVNFLMATSVFEMPASLFSRYLDFFDIEKATPMQTWDQGTRRIYEAMSRPFQDRICLNRPVKKVRRMAGRVEVEDVEGRVEVFDEVIFACNANQTLMILDKPSRLESFILSSIRYESELHNHTIVHYDASVLPDNETHPLKERSNFIEQYGSRPDNYEITYIMHNQQPWALKSDKPCLVTYNPVSDIDRTKIIKTWWFQHIVHDVFHVSVVVNLFRFIQGRKGTWHCGAHTLINSQETCFVSGLATARQLGADYPFQDREAARWFNFYGGLMYGWRFRKASVRSTSEQAGV